MISWRADDRCGFDWNSQKHKCLTGSQCMELRAAVVVLLSCCVWWFSSLLLLVLNRPSLSLVYRYILCFLKLPLFFGCYCWWQPTRGGGGGWLMIDDDCGDDSRQTCRWESKWWHTKTDSEQCWRKSMSKHPPSTPEASPRIRKSYHLLAESLSCFSLFKFNLNCSIEEDHVLKCKLDVAHCLLSQLQPLPSSFWPYLVYLYVLSVTASCAGSFKP